MEKDVILQGAIAEITPLNFEHPGLRQMKFIFCDDKPNFNKQGIEQEDFAAIAMSAVGTPIKMKYVMKRKRTGLAAQDGGDIGGHESSIPIGFIKAMTERKLDDGTNQLIADAVLFAEEYPEEVDFLEKAFAAKKAPGVSWELKHSEEKSVVRDGVTWLKGLITKAASIVKNPAYGDRTAILALASDRNLSNEDFLAGISAITTEDSPKNTTKGGSNRMTDEEIQKLKDDLAAATSALAAKTEELTAKASEISTLTGEKETLTTTLSERDATIETFTTEKKVAERTNALTEAGITVTIKPERLMSFTDESFAEYVSELKAVAEASAKKTPAKGELSLASASRKNSGIPKFTPDDNPTVSSLTDKFKSISRTRESAATE